MHYLTRRLQPPTIATTVDLGELSYICGGGSRNVTSPHCRVHKSLRRLELFGYIRHDGHGRCDVRTTISPMGPLRVAKLADEMRHLLAKYQSL